MYWKNNEGLVITPWLATTLHKAYRFISRHVGVREFLQGVSRAHEMAES